MTGLRRSAKARSLPARSAKRRISSARRSSGSTTASTTSSEARWRMSMSSAYSSRFSATKRLALGLVLDRLDLVVEDGVDRRLRAHHRDRGAGQGDAAVGLEGRPGHRVEAGAVGLADDHRELRHGRFGDGADHLRPVADDPLALDRGADHEAGHVGEEEQRHVEGVAGLDEARRLVGRVDEEHAALLARLVGDDADDAAVEPAVADDQLLRPALVDLEEGVGVEQRRRAPRACRRAGSRRRGRSRRSARPRPGAAGGAAGGSSRQLPGMKER